MADPFESTEAELVRESAVIAMTVVLTELIGQYPMELLMHEVLRKGGMEAMRILIDGLLKLEDVDFSDVMEARMEVIGG